MTDSFLTRLREAREAVGDAEIERQAIMSDFWEHNPDGGSPTKGMMELAERIGDVNSEYVGLLVNNAAKIERVIESAEGWLPYLEETNASFADVKELREAIAALNENADRPQRPPIDGDRLRKGQ